MGDDFAAYARKLLIPVTIAVMGGFARFAFSENRSFVSFIRGVVIAAFVGVMVSLALQDTFLSESMRGMIIGVSSFCADEVVLFLLACAKEVRNDPLKYLMNILTAVRGGSDSKSDPPKSDD